MPLVLPRGTKRGEEGERAGKNEAATTISPAFGHQRPLSLPLYIASRNDHRRARSLARSDSCFLSLFVRGSLLRGWLGLSRALPPSQSIPIHSPSSLPSLSLVAAKSHIRIVERKGRGTSFSSLSISILSLSVPVSVLLPCHFGDHKMRDWNHASFHSRGLSANCEENQKGFSNVRAITSKRQTIGARTGIEDGESDANNQTATDRLRRARQEDHLLHLRNGPATTTNQPSASTHPHPRARPSLPSGLS